MKDDDKPARNIFFNKIENRFESFKNKIVNLSYKNNIGFDEDVFMDSILRCTETFKNENATEIDVDNYFWKAYKQNMISSCTRDKFKNFVPLDKIKDDNNDCVYSDDIDEIVKIITTEVKENFGDKILDAWLLHICNGVTYEELECEYAGLNLHNEFRQIKRYIHNKFIKENNRFKTLLVENNFI
jgi:hypothetical protein